MACPVKRPTVTRRGLLSAGAVGAATVLAGCNDPQPRRSGSGKVDKITYVTGFNITGQDSFIFTAIDKGWFAEAGIEVEVVAGSGTLANLAKLTAGAAQIGVIDVAGGIIETMRGAHPKFTLFEAIYQRSVSCIVALPQSGIQQPKDLVGKTIAGTQGGVNVSLFPGYARAADFDPDAVKWEWLAAAGIRPAFLAGQVQAATEIVIGLPAVEAAARQVGKLREGQALTVLDYPRYLGDLYGNAIGATQEFAKEHPELLIRFRDAATRAMVWTIDHPDEAAKIMVKYNQAYKPEVAAAEIRQTIPYVRSGATPIGHIDKFRMARCIALIQGLGLIPSGLTAEQIVDFNLVPAA